MEMPPPTSPPSDSSQSFAALKMSRGVRSRDIRAQHEVIALEPFGNHLLFDVGAGRERKRGRENAIGH